MSEKDSGMSHCACTRDEFRSMLGRKFVPGSIDLTKSIGPSFTGS